MTQDSELKAGFRLDLDEVSALAVRRGAELVAVGDEDFRVVTAALRDGGLEDEDATSVRDILDDDMQHEESGSEWEAVAADGEGRVFIVKESSLTVVVLSPGLNEHVHTIKLDVEDGPDEQAKQLLDDENAGPEAILLLDDGHLLTVKQKDPALLIEFGAPDHHSPTGFASRAPLWPGARFELSDGHRTTLVALRSWQLRDEDDNDFKSANDLAVDDAGRVHAISSRSRRLYELPPRSGETKIVAQRGWGLPDEIDRHDGKAEGLAFDRDGHPIVAIDSKAKGLNVFLLERLPR